MTPLRQSGRRRPARQANPWRQLHPPKGRRSQPHPEKNPPSAPRGLAQPTSVRLQAIHIALAHRYSRWRQKSARPPRVRRPLGHLHALESPRVLPNRRWQPILPPVPGQRCLAVNLEISPSSAGTSRESRCREILREPQWPAPRTRAQPAQALPPAKPPEHTRQGSPHVSEHSALPGSQPSLVAERERVRYARVRPPS